MGGVVQPLQFTVEGTKDLPKVTHQEVAELEQEPRSPFGAGHRPSRGPEKGEFRKPGARSPGNQEGTFTLLCLWRVQEN